MKLVRALLIMMLWSFMVKGFGHTPPLKSIDIQDYANKDYSLFFDSLSKVFETYDKNDVLRYIADLEAQGKKHNDLAWVLETEMMEVRYFNDRRYTSMQESIKGLEKILKKTENTNFHKVRARAFYLIFRRQWYLGDYENAFQSLQELEQLLEKIPAESFELMAIYLYRIGEAFYSFHDYNKANDVFRRVENIRVNAFNSHAIMEALNTSGLIYQDNMQLDSADHYFYKVLLIAKNFDRTLWKAIAFGNLGKSAYLTGNYDKAMPWLKYDYTVALDYGDYGLAAGSGTILADIYTQRDQLDSAEFYIGSTYRNIQKSNQTHRFRFLFPVMALYESKMGNPRQAVIYLDSAAFYKDKYQREFSSRLLLRVNQKEYQTKMFSLHAEESRKRLNWIIGFSFSGLVVLFLGLGIFWSRKNIRMNRWLSEMIIDKKNRELQDAEIQLRQFVHKIVQNEELIQSLLQQNADHADEALLEELRRSRILTEDDWGFFKKKFNMVYSGFINALTRTYAELTQSEIRYLSLVRLQLSKNEIATALGVSPNSLRVTWHRIRKKLDLSYDTSPEVFVGSIQEPRRSVQGVV